LQVTRQEILDYLHRNRRASVGALAAVLDLTTTGIRQHLNLLQRDGLVECVEERGRVGRPALIYSLTDKGENLYPKSYGLLANLLIEEVRTIVSGGGLLTLLRRVASRMADPYLARAEGRSAEDRVRLTVEALHDRGCEADWERSGDDLLIHQYTCPFPEVAQKNSAVCAMDVNFISRLTGSDARLSESVLRGDRCCTYRIRPRPDHAVMQVIELSESPARPAASP
jgi:predicted ArsR family transcriptional regulator